LEPSMDAVVDIIVDVRGDHLGGVKEDPEDHL
jgi:hypothetical protein